MSRVSGSEQRLLENKSIVHEIRYKIELWLVVTNPLHTFLISNSFTETFARPIEKTLQLLSHSHLFLVYVDGQAVDSGLNPLDIVLLVQPFNTRFLPVSLFTIFKLAISCLRADTSSVKVMT